MEQKREAKRGGARLKDVVCCDCGAMIKNTGATRKRCPECAAAHKLVYARNYMRYQRNSYPETGNIIHRNRKGCDGCIYFFAEHAVNKCCNYIFIKGKRRPCPPGDECTEWVGRG